jgi:hypothetical protein
MSRSLESGKYHLMDSQSNSVFYIISRWSLVLTVSIISHRINRILLNGRFDFDNLDAEVANEIKNFELNILIFLSFLGWGETLVHLVRRPLIGLLYQPRILDDECGAVGGIRIGRGNRNTRRKTNPVPLCPPRIPYFLTWARTRAAAVGTWRLIAWAMAWVN